jgi:hypothetical protein
MRCPLDPSSGLLACPRDLIRQLHYDETPTDGGSKHTIWVPAIA